MHANVGTIDRIARAAAGVALIGLPLHMYGPLGDWTAWGWLGLIPLVSAVLGWCPLYSLVGLDTTGALPKS